MIEWDGLRYLGNSVRDCNVGSSSRGHERPFVDRAIIGPYDRCCINPCQSVAVAFLTLNGQPMHRERHRVRERNLVRTVNAEQ